MNDLNLGPWTPPPTYPSPPLTPADMDDLDARLVSVQPPPAMSATKTVEIPARDQHEGLYRTTIPIANVCRVCGGPRGEVFRTHSYDGSRRMSVDGWTNSCGHVDTYGAVRAEAWGEIVNPFAPVVSVVNEVVAWYYKYFRGLDTAGWDSASAHFEDHYTGIGEADDRTEAAVSALRSTMEYCGAPGNEDMVAECQGFLHRIKEALAAPLPVTEVGDTSLNHDAHHTTADDTSAPSAAGEVAR